MKWLKKRKYSRGFDSPGSTAEIIAKSHKNNLIMGYSENDSCEEIFEQYIETFSMFAFPIPYGLLFPLKETIDADIVTTTFIIICLGQDPFSGRLEIIQRDLDIIVELIIEKQRAILNDRSIGNPSPLLQCKNIISFIINFGT